MTDPEDPTLHAAGAEPAPLGELIAALSVSRRWEAQLAGGDLQARWADVVGEVIAAHTEPVRLKGGVLVLRADSPVWATQVRYLAAELARQVNHALGSDAVRQVHVTGAPARS